jgi:hypothetical protein
MFCISTLFLRAGDEKGAITLSGGSTKYASSAAVPTETKPIKAITVSYDGLTGSYVNMPFLRKYAELDYKHDYGFFIEGYSYTELRTNGLRLGYKYDDPQSQWSPFLTASVQRASREFTSDIQPRNNFGANIGLAFSFTHEHVLTLTLFREFMKNQTSVTTLDYTFDCPRLFGEAKVALVVGSPDRGPRCDRRVNWAGKFGTHIGDHFSMFAYTESLRYKDFLFFEQQNTGIGIRASF